MFPVENQPIHIVDKYEMSWDCSGPLLRFVTLSCIFEDKKRGSQLGEDSFSLIRNLSNNHTLSLIHTVKWRHMCQGFVKQTVWAMDLGKTSELNSNK